MAGIRIYKQKGDSRLPHLKNIKRWRTGIPEYNESHYWAEARAGWFLTYPRHE